VAQPAEGHAVRRFVIPALPPRDDMGRLDHGMAVRGEHADTAKGATVVIEGHYRLSETLIPDLFSL